MARRRSTPIEPKTPAKEQPPGTGPESAGQSGDQQGLSGVEYAESESVRELVEEGQYYEGSVVEGVENAPPADAGPVRVHKRKEDDLPPEHADLSKDEPKE